MASINVPLYPALSLYPSPTLYPGVQSVPLEALGAGDGATATPISGNVTAGYSTYPSPQLYPSPNLYPGGTRQVPTQAAVVD